MTFADVKRDVFKVFLQIHSLPKYVSTFKPENKNYYYTYYLHIKISVHYIYYNHLFTDKLKIKLGQKKSWYYSITKMQNIHSHFLLIAKTLKNLKELRMNTENLYFIDFIGVYFFSNF